jgi:GDP-L-fucose synthase
MKKLITGGNGLIGSEFEEGIKVCRQEYNLIDSLDVDRMYSDIKPDFVIHTAAKVGGVGANMRKKGDFFYENIMINTNVIHYAKKHNVKKLIAFLSTCVFPDKVDYPLTENKIDLGPPHFSNDAYAYAKRMSQVQISAYNEQYGTKYFCVIPTNVYGPQDNYNLNDSHVLPALIHKCYLAIKNNTKLELWGDGSPLREFIYSKDVAIICDRLLLEYEETSPIIISTSEEISIKEVAEKVAKLMGYKNKIYWDTSKPNGQFRKPSNNSKLKSVLKDLQFTPLEEGLYHTIEYFIKNYEKIRK